MKELLKNVLPLVLLGLGGLGCWAFIALRSPPERSAPPVLTPGVEVQPVDLHAGSFDLEVDGVAAPFREITLSAEVSGRIVTKSESCRPGKFVKQGEVLLQIDPRNYQLELDRLNEELKQAQATRAELDVEIDNAANLLENSKQDLSLQRSELERLQRVGPATTRSEIEQAQRAVLTSESRIIELNNLIRLNERRKDRLDSAIELATAKRDLAQLDLERTTITSPVDGVVVEEFIEQDALAQMGAQLVTIEDTSAIEVKCSLEIEELHWIWSQATQFSPSDRYQLPPLPATVTYQAGGHTYSWQGKLSRYDGIGFDQRTRMVPCRVLVDEPFQVSADERHPEALDIGNGQAIVPALMRGMFVTVGLSVSPKQQLLSVPRRAIQPTGDLILYQPGASESGSDATGTARMVRVKVLHYKYDRAIVVPLTDAVTAGSQVVTSPLPGVSPFELRERGVAVRAVQPEGKGAES